MYSVLKREAFEKRFLVHWLILVTSLGGVDIGTGINVGYAAYGYSAPSPRVIYRSLPYVAQLNSARELYNTTSKISEYLDDSEAYENALDEFERDALDHYAENCKEYRCF